MDDLEELTPLREQRVRLQKIREMETNEGEMRHEIERSNQSKVINDKNDDTYSYTIKQTKKRIQWTQKQKNSFFTCTDVRL